MKQGNPIAKIAIRVGIAVLVILAAAIAAFFILRSVGKSSLYKDYAKPKLTVSTKELEAEAIEAYEDDGTITYNGNKYRYNEDILTFLIIGVDSLKKLPKAEEVTDYTKGGQADALFLAIINPHTEEIEVVAINRDSLAEVDVYDSDGNFIETEMLQICLQHGFGSGLEDSCERQVKAVSHLFFDIPINGYLSMNMAAIPIMNDAVGFVTVTSLENIPLGSKSLAKGEGTEITLEGMDSYYYLKYRDTKVFNSSSMRLARQRQYIEAFSKKIVACTKNDVSFPLKLLSELSDYMVTDISTDEVTYLVSSCIGYTFNKDDIYTLSGETKENSAGYEEFTVDDDALYDLIIQLFYEKVE